MIEDILDTIDHALSDLTISKDAMQWDPDFLQEPDPEPEPQPQPQPQPFTLQWNPVVFRASNLTRSQFLAIFGIPERMPLPRESHTLSVSSDHGVRGVGA